MKNNKNHSSDFLDEKLEEIKRNEIFDIPEEYFENLEQKLFVQRRSEFLSGGAFSMERKRPRIITLLGYAASLLIILGAAWWFWLGPDQKLPERLIPEYVLEQYLEDEIMELDLEFLLQDLTNEDLQILSNSITLPYESYIDAHFEDFEEFMY